MDTDTCNPNASYKLTGYKFYSIVMPALLMVLVLEVVFVFMSIPTTIGSAFTESGPFSTAKAQHA